MKINGIGVINKKDVAKRFCISVGEVTKILKKKK